MAKRYAESTIAELKNARIEGKSIHELMDIFSMPKTTVWHHIKDVELGEAAEKRIRARQGGSKERKKRAIKKARAEAHNMIDEVSLPGALPAVYAMLYWAEGNKRHSLVFTNTDEKLIRVYVYLLRKVLCIKEKDIEALIRTYGEMNDEACLKYWKSVTELPAQNIRVDRNERHNRSRTKYGICRIRVKKGGYYLKLTHGLIDALAENLVSTYDNQVEKNIKPS